MNIKQLELIKKIRGANEDVLPYLTGKARWMIAKPEIKSYEYFLRTLIHLVHNVYDGYIAGEFIDIMANLVQGQLTRAYHEAVTEAGLEISEMTPEMELQLEQFILSEYDYVDRFYRDIVDARIDETPVKPLLARAELWANRFNDVKNQAKVMINSIFGNKLEWMLGETEEHCETCSRLNGLVAFASEWQESGILPQNPPNPILECGGWQCDCSLQVTDKRRSPKVIDTLRDIAVSMNL